MPRRCRQTPKKVRAPLSIIGSKCLTINKHAIALLSSTVVATVAVQSLAPGQAADLALSTSEITVSEGQAATYSLQLSARPQVSVSVLIGSSDSDAVDVSSTSLTFTAKNWNLAQTVTLTAVRDSDGEDEFVSISHRDHGGTVTVTVKDDGAVPPIPPVNSIQKGAATNNGTAQAASALAMNESRGYVFTVQSLSVSEGGSVFYGVKLTSAPVGGTAYIDVLRVTGGDRDIKVGSSNYASLEFDATNWDEFQSVTVTADEDSDAVSSVTAIAHAGDQTDYQNLRSDLAVTEIDNDVALLFSTTALTVSEGGAGHGILWGEARGQAGQFGDRHGQQGKRVSGHGSDSADGDIPDFHDGQLEQFPIGRRDGCQR